MVATNIKGYMTVFDIFVLLLMGGGAIFGFLRGFVFEALALFAWGLVVIAVRFLHDPVSNYFTGPMGNATTASIVAFLSIIILTYALGRWFARSAGARTKKSVLGPVDRVLGFGFGMIKGLIFATLFYLLFAMIYDGYYGSSAPRPEWLADSRTYPLIHASGDAMIEFVGEDPNKAESDGASDIGV